MQKTRLQHSGLILALCLAGCLLAPVIYSENGHSDDVLTRRLHAQFFQPDAVTQSLTLDWTYLEHLYIQRQFVPVWVTLNGPNTRATILRQFLHVADQEGLTPSAYHLSAIDSTWHQRTPSELASLDILLTDALYRYAIDVRMGRLSPEEADPQWHLVRSAIRPATLVQKLLSARDFESAMRNLPPQQIGYQRLRDALARYRRMSAEGEWPMLPDGPSLREGTHSRQVAILHKRLQMEGYLQAGQSLGLHSFDPAVKYAVDQFQVRHGLKMDGVVGPATRRAMNVSLSDRITQIKLNMERWRWLPRNLGERYLIVNSAGYELTAFDQGQERFSMWVVIGKQDRQTPVIGGVMHTVVFNPYWTVPMTIVMKDLIPAQIRNPNYLRTHRIHVYANLSKRIEVDPRKLDWSAYNSENFPYVLRQDPGPDNPMGRYKFLFSNVYDVYLHDTPMRRLFNYKQRTFSSGCIRVENPQQLSTYLLARNPGWDESQVQAAVASGRTSEVKLAKSVPIYLMYLTVWVGADERVHFYPDVYQRDQPIALCVSSDRHGVGQLPVTCTP